LWKEKQKKKPYHTSFNKEVQKFQYWFPELWASVSTLEADVSQFCGRNFL
jgi:hypothetical protein